MKLHAPFIQLPLVFDAAVLAAEIAALGEGPWRPHPQGFPGNSMLPLLAVDGDPRNESFAGTMRPTPELLACPYLTQTIASLGATAGRSRLMRLSGHAEVTRHADQGYYWAERVRVHVPVVTQPTVRFECGGTTLNMAAGECWIFDTWRQHSVLNDAVQSRIHLVVDTVGGGRFWDLVGQGRIPAFDGSGADGEATTAGWQPRRIEPQPGLIAPIACESVNLPTVMSPWELNGHLGLLLSDAVPHPRLAAVRVLVQRFARHWQGLWAQYGDAPEGRPHFRAALQAFLAQARDASQGLLLANQLQWFGALMTLVGKVAVAAEPGAPVARPAAIQPARAG